MKYISFSLLIITLISITSCGSSSSLIASWKTDDFSPKVYEKVVVFALTPNEQNRNLFEMKLTNELTKDSIKAFPSFSVFPLVNSVLNITKDITDSLYLEQIKAGIKDKIKSKNIDALLILTLLDVQKEQTYVSGTSLTMGGNMGYGGYGGYYGNMTPGIYSNSHYDNYYSYSYATIYETGYYKEEITYFIESRLYDSESQKLIWVGQTKTVDLSNIEIEAEQIARIITKELISQGIVLSTTLVD